MIGGPRNTYVDRIENPVTGQQVTFVMSTPEVLVTEWLVGPNRPADPEHIHPIQEEHLFLLQGRIRRDLGSGRSDHLEEGGDWVIAPGVSHTWANATQEPIRLRIEFRPALRTEEFMTRIFGLAAAGKVNAKGVPNPLQVSVLATEYAPEIRITHPPALVQKIAFAILAPIARRLGYR